VRNATIGVHDVHRTAAGLVERPLHFVGYQDLRSHNGIVPRFCCHRQPLAGRTTSQKNAISADPLFEPLRKIGVDEPGISRIFRQCTRSNIQRWIKITDAAMHEKPQGFPGFKASPAAFFIDGVQNQRLPPDWIYAHEKEQHQRQWEKARAGADGREQALRTQYEQERAAALRAYLNTPTGRQQFQSAYEQFLVFYRAVEPHRFEAAAVEAATGKVEREQFQFPQFGVWLLEQQTQRS
jgi:hypothetical protein